MKLGRRRSKLAVCVLLAMLSNIVPAQAEGVQSHSSASVQEEALESPLYEKLLAQDIEKLESTGSSGAAALAGPPQDPQSRGSHPSQNGCVHHSPQAGPRSTPMIADTTPIAPSSVGAHFDELAYSAEYDSPMYSASLTSSIRKIEQTPARNRMKVAKSVPAWPERKIENCPPTYASTCGGTTCESTCSSTCGSTCFSTCAWGDL